jgi:hypothetical protein
VDVTAIAVVCFANACCAPLPMRLPHSAFSPASTYEDWRPMAEAAKRSRSRRGVGRLDRFTSGHLHLFICGDPNVSGCSSGRRAVSSASPWRVADKGLTMSLQRVAPVAAGGELALGLPPERGAAHHLGELLSEVRLRLQHRGEPVHLTHLRR